MRSDRRNDSRFEDVVLPFGAPSGEPRSRGPRRRSTKPLKRLAYSSPILALLVAVAVVLIGLPVWSAHALGRWDAGERAVAESEYSTQADWTARGPETWVARFNLGTALLARGALDEGVARLREALETVPRALDIGDGRIETYSYECRVRINLALGLEMQGDEAGAAGDWTGAADLYDESAATVSTCLPPSQSQSGNPQQSGAQQPQSGSDESQSSSDSQSSGSGSGSGRGPQGSSDHGQQAGESANRAEQKADEARRRAAGSDSSGSQDQGGSSSDGAGNDDSGSTGGSDSADGAPGDSGEGGDASPNTGSSEDPGTPYEGESADEARRRNELEQRLRSGGSGDEGAAPGTRSGDSNGAW